MVDLWDRGICENTCGYLYTGERKAVIETGPATSVPQILHELDNLGLEREEIDYIIVTHIHLDHAGGAGRLAQELPRAQVMVHHRGARHLADPSRLRESASQAWGVPVEQVFGELIPIPQDRLLPLHEGDVIDLGAACRLQVLETPGHAPHHLCFYDPLHQFLFAGDTLGIYYPAFARLAGTRFLHPMTPLPDFDLAKMHQDLYRLSQLDVAATCFTHFGPLYGPVGALCEQAAGKLVLWEKLVQEVWPQHNDLEDVAQAFFNQCMHSVPPVSGPEAILLKETKALLRDALRLAAGGFVGYLQLKSEK